MRAPINSVKHILQHTTTQVTTGTVTTLVEAVGEHIQDVSNVQEVVEGSLIKAIYVEYWILGTFSEGSYVMCIEKSEFGNPSPIFTEMSTLNSYENKKNVLFISQGLIGEDNANPTPVLRQWVKIPKGKQRFGLKDKLRINFAFLGSDDIQFCGFTLYKSYT